MVFAGDYVFLPFLTEHPEWLNEVRLAEIDGELELLGTADAIAAFCNWAADRGILEDPDKAAEIVKSMRAEDDRLCGAPNGGEI